MRAHRWAALVVSVLITAIPLSASASGDLLRPADGSALDFEHLTPGSVRTGNITVTNPSDGQATVALEIRITDQHEAGCLRQELELEADRCEDTGELGDWLDASISRDDQQVWAGRIKELDEPQSLPGALAAGDSWDLELTVGMPVEAGNDTMTDRIDFDLVAHLATATGEETDVLGAQGFSTGAADGSNGVVPTVVDAGLSVLSLDALEKAEAERLITLGTLGFVVLLVTGLLVVERRRHRP